MGSRPSTAALRWALAAAATGIGVAAIALTQLQTAASAPATSPVSRLELGQPYRSPLLAGNPVQITFKDRSLSPGSTVYLLAISASGGVVGQDSRSPGAAELRRGEITFETPHVMRKPAYWIALSPRAGARAPGLRVSTLGAELSATLQGVPKGAGVYLLGWTDGGDIASYVPPAACLPDPSTGGMIICNFAAPTGYKPKTVSFDAFTFGRSEAALPLNNLPEAPAAAALPLVALLVYALARRLRT